LIHLPEGLRGLVGFYIPFNPLDHEQLLLHRQPNSGTSFCSVMVGKHS
jgi:hypothetical protein